MPSITQVKMSAKAVTENDLAPATYLKLAKSIGLQSAATEEARVLDLLYNHHFKVYDYAKVDDYLYNQALSMKVNTRWVWKPVRDKDLTAVNDSRNTWQTQNGMGFVYPKVYGKKIPERILEDVGCVLTDIADAIFLVSDFEAIKPDPFLAVTTPLMLKENKIFIVDVWDEPGFVDKAPTATIAMRIHIDSKDGR